MPNLVQIANDLPWGFHDAYLHRLEMDWVTNVLALDVRLQMTQRQDWDQLARIVIREVAFFCASPPTSSEGPVEVHDEIPWIDGQEGAGDFGIKLPDVPAGYFLHHLYLRGSWQVFHICGRDAELRWLEGAPRPARSATRALFAGEQAGEDA